MANVYGYVRVSTRGQNYETQVEDIKKFCGYTDHNLLRVFEDKVSGKSVEREGFQEMMQSLEKNPQGISMVVATKLDRVGRSVFDLITIFKWLQEHNIDITFTQSNINTSTSEGRLMFHFMGAMAEYERERILERTEEGRVRYLAKGGKLGKPKLKIPSDEIKRLKTEGVPITKIAERFNVSRETIYDRLNEVKKE